MMNRFGDWTSVADQATAASVDLARLLSRYFRQLRDEGFNREEALTLTNTLSQELLRMEGRGE